MQPEMEQLRLKWRVRDRKRWRDGVGRKLYIDNTLINVTFSTDNSYLSNLTNANTSQARDNRFASTIEISFLVEPLGQASPVQTSPFLRFFFNIVGNKLRRLIGPVHGTVHGPLHPFRYTIHQSAGALLSIL